MYFFGYTLFSVPFLNSNRFVISRGDSEEYIQNLFKKDRMDRRFDTFEALTLPSLDQFIESDGFYYFVFYSEEMPSEYSEKLLLLCKEYAFVVPVAVPLGGEVRVSHQIKKIMSENGSSEFACFQIDDDDMLSKDYLKILGEYVSPEYVGMYVSFSNGYTGVFSFDERSVIDARQCRFPFVNIGQARIGYFDADKNEVNLPKKVSHMKPDEHYPTIVDSRSKAFFWTRHVFQDTFGGDIDKANKNIMIYMDQYAPAKFEEMQQLFPVFKGVSSKPPKKLYFFEDNGVFLKKKSKTVVFDSSGFDFQDISSVELVYDVSLEQRRSVYFSFDFGGFLSGDEEKKLSLVRNKHGYYRYCLKEGGRISFKIPLGVKGMVVHAVNSSLQDVTLNKVEMMGVFH